MKKEGKHISYHAVPSVGHFSSVSKSSRPLTMHLPLIQIKAYWGVPSQAVRLGAGLQMGMSSSVQINPTSHPQPCIHTPPQRWDWHSHNHALSQLREFIQLKTNHLNFIAWGFGWINSLNQFTMRSPVHKWTKVFRLLFSNHFQLRLPLKAEVYPPLATCPHVRALSIMVARLVLFGCRAGWTEECIPLKDNLPLPKGWCSAGWTSLSQPSFPSAGPGGHGCF